MVKRGEIWLAALRPTVGSEIQKTPALRYRVATRPCVIVSPSEMHDYLKTVIVAPDDHWKQTQTVSDCSDIPEKKGIDFIGSDSSYRKNAIN